jgi:hypothetical protein
VTGRNVRAAGARDRGGCIVRRSAPSPPAVNPEITNRDLTSVQ